MITATFAFLFATLVPRLVTNVVSPVVNRVIRHVRVMILSSFANKGTLGHEQASPCNSHQVVHGVRRPFA